MNFAILDDKVRFLETFYHLTTEPFREIQRKIEAGEAPYVDRRGPEYYDEAVFLSEWQDADQALKLQRQVCLSLLQRSFKEFLDRIVRQDLGQKPRKPKGGESWFDVYKEWFSNLGIDWDRAPVTLARLEELSLARNCVQHGGEVKREVLDSHSLLKKQSAYYHERFPDAFFADEFEKKLWEEQNYPQPVTIDLTPEKLEAAVSDILTFCRFIHEQLEALV